VDIASESCSEWGSNRFFSGLYEREINVMWPCGKPASQTARGMAEGQHRSAHQIAGMGNCSQTRNKPAYWTKFINEQ
jgi:hypothetical protein